MAKGASQSQSSTSTTTRPGPVGAPPHGSTSGMRRRRVSNSSTSSGGGFSGSGGNSNVLRFYTDDAPGWKISPTMVLVMSLCFIGFVTALHVFGKLYRNNSA